MSSTNLAEVPPLRELTAAEFRLSLVEVQSPTKALDAMSRAAMRDEAISFLSILPQLYGMDDPMRVWEYVAKAVESAGMSVRDDDMVGWSSSIVDTLQCPGWKAATHEAWGNFQAMADSRPPEWRGQFIAYVSRSIGALLPLARQKHKAWQAERKLQRGASS